MSIHFNQQVLYSFSRGTLDTAFLQNCIDKGYNLNQSLFDGDGNLNRDIFYFVTKSYHESIEELVFDINFLINNGFDFQTTNCNYLYYFLLAISRLQLTSHPSTMSFICSFILKMQLKFNSISYYYDPDLFEFILIDSSKKTKYTKLPISSIVFLFVTQLSLTNLYDTEDSELSENAIISKETYKNEITKIEWITSLKKLFPVFDFSKEVYVLKRLM